MSGSTPSAGSRPLRIGGLESLWYPQAALVCVAAAAITAFFAVGLVGSGSYALSTGQIISALLSPDGGPASTVIWHMRLPRVVTGLATGACLGVAGLVFQGISRNALGSPEIIGLVSGAALGAVVGITLLGTTGWGTSLSAIAGCGVAAGLGRVLVPRGPAAVARMVLIGIGLSALWSSGTSLLLTRTDPNVAVAGQIWLTGSLVARTWEHALVPAVALVVLVPLIVASARALDLLSTGDDMAAQLGADLPRLMRLATVVGLGLTGAAIASTGPISFVALAAPQIARSLTDHRVVPVTTSALVGATLLVGAEWSIQQLPESAHGPVGLATSVLGGIYLIAMMTRRTQ